MLSSKKMTRTIETVIGESTMCDGKVSCETNLRVEGRVAGDIECTGEVVVGENAVVQSSIHARDVVIAGIVNGTVSAKGKLTIMPTGQLTGNVDAAAIVIHEGGIFSGSSSMSPRSTVSPMTGKTKEGKGSKANQEQEQAANAG